MPSSTCRKLPLHARVQGRLTLRLGWVRCVPPVEITWEVQKDVQQHGEGAFESASGVRELVAGNGPPPGDLLRRYAERWGVPWQLDTPALPSKNVEALRCVHHSG